MRSMRTCFLLAGATLFSGIGAGVIADRVVVGGPAWHHLGAAAWVQYSRNADLGTGLYFYPIVYIGAAILAIATIVSYRCDGPVRGDRAIPLYLAAAFSVVVLLLTVKAAPIMLALDTPQTPESSARALYAFYFWGLYLRGASAVFAFVAELWALVVLQSKR